ncbi:hypothetical protein [Actinomyces oricola]|nr:hypothetical protein [Actinomyces oricola]
MDLVSSFMRQRTVGNGRYRGGRIVGAATTSDGNRKHAAAGAFGG